MKYKIENQPKSVLLDYIEYVDGSISMDAVPWTFDQWANYELNCQTPISVLINL